MGCHYFSPDIIGYRNPPRRFFTCGPMIQHRVGWAEGANVPAMPGSLRPARPCPLWWTDFTGRPSWVRFVHSTEHQHARTPPRGALHAHRCSLQWTKSTQIPTPVRFDRYKGRASMCRDFLPRAANPGPDHAGGCCYFSCGEAYNGTSPCGSRDRAPILSWREIGPSRLISAAVTLIPRELGPPRPARPSLGSPDER